MTPQNHRDDVAAPTPTETQKPPETCQPHPSVAPEETRPEPDKTGPAKANAEMDAMEQLLMEQMHARMDKLEKKMVNELSDRKRQLEENLESEYASKKQCLQKEIDSLMEQKSDEESRLALVAEQLQEKMLCVTEEQAALDDLKSKSQLLQQKLDDAATVEVKEGEEDAKAKQKEALRLKLQNAQATQSQVPSTPKVPSPPPSASPPPSSVQSLSPGGEVVPVSSQRFTSSTHPEAWQYLYRLTRTRDKCGDDEIYKAWHEGFGFSMQSQTFL